MGLSSREVLGPWSLEKWAGYLRSILWRRFQNCGSEGDSGHFLVITSGSSYLSIFDRVAINGVLI